MKTIQSVEKAVSILNYIAQNNGKLTLTELSRELDMSMGTLHGFIATLEKCRMIRKNEENSKYFLGELIFKYSLINDSRTALADICRPYLNQLRDVTNETVHLALPTQDRQIIYIAKAESRLPFRLTSLVGTIEDAELSAIGLLLFDGTPRVSSPDILYKAYAQTNYCLKFEPHLDAFCIGASFPYSARPDFAGISIVVPKVRFLEHGEEFYVKPLTDIVSALRKETLTL